MTSAQYPSMYDDTVPSSGPYPGAESLPLREGQIIAGRYQVGSLLGAGGMALVFAGKHLELDSQVAIKVIRPQLSKDSHIAKRFVNEARGVAALNNAHIARVFDVGQLDSGEPFLVMERLSGRSLLTMLREFGTVSCEQAAEYVVQACQGLADAHAQGLIHRDIKPEHLFVVSTPGAEPFVKVLDFGISKRLGNDAEGRVTNPGDSIGSPCYMSPEQMQNPASVDERTDVWSLGVVLYEVLAGARPFDGETLGQIQWQVLAETPPPLSELRPEVPAALERIVARCLHKNREDRFASVNDLASALRSYLIEHHAGSVAVRAGVAGAGAGSARPRAVAEGTSAPPSSYPEDPVVPEQVAGLPRRRGGLRVLLLMVVAVSVGIVLWLWAAGRVVVWTTGVGSEVGQGDSINPASKRWSPPDGPLVTIDYGELGAHTVEPSEPSAPDSHSDETHPDDEGEQATRSGAEPGGAREQLTQPEREARYQRWLESQGLVPVDEVMVRAPNRREAD